MNYSSNLASNGRGNGKKNRRAKFNNGYAHYKGEGQGRAPYGNQPHAPPGVPPTGGYPTDPPATGQTPRGNDPMSLGGMGSGIDPIQPTPRSVSNASEAGINMRGEAPAFVPTIYAPIPRRNGTGLTDSNMIAASTPATPVRAEYAGQCTSVTAFIIQFANPGSREPSRILA